MPPERQAPATAPAEPTLTLEQQMALMVQAMTASQQLQAESNAKIAALMERQADFSEKTAPRRRKTLTEYLAEKPRKRLMREVYQNGRPVNPQGLSAETIKTLDTLAPGKYADGLVDVVRVADGPGNIHSRIHLMYNTKHESERMQIYMKFPSFSAMVRAIAAEMAANGVAPVMDAVADPVEVIEEVVKLPTK